MRKIWSILCHKGLGATRVSTLDNLLPLSISPITYHLIDTSQRDDQPRPFRVFDRLHFDDVCRHWIAMPFDLVIAAELPSEPLKDLGIKTRASASHQGLRIAWPSHGICTCTLGGQPTRYRLTCGMGESLLPSQTRPSLDGEYNIVVQSVLGCRRP